MSLARAERSHFVHGLCCSPATPPARQAAGGTLLVQSFLPVGPTPQSPRDGPCVPVEVSAVALATCPGVRTLAGGARASAQQGHLAQGSLSSSGCAGAGEGRRFVSTG